MKISEYIKEYTDSGTITFYNMMMELNELVVEIAKIKWNGIKEEFGDVFLFLQAWLYCRFRIDGELWKVSRNSAKKFSDRKLIWNKIYTSVGLQKNISGYVGNYNKVEKVVNHLQKFGIDREKAEESFKKIVKFKELSFLNINERKKII